MSLHLLAQAMLVILFVLAVFGLYQYTKRTWYVRFDRGQGFYDEEAVLITAHSFEGAKRTAKRINKRHRWDGFKLRTY